MWFTAYDVHMWCSHMTLTCGIHIWCSHVVVFICGLHIWWSHVEFICGVYMWFTACMVCDLSYMISVYGVHMWFTLKSYTNIKSYTVNHMWFSVYDFRIWSPHMISAYGVHIWFSSMIIYGPYMIIYGNHMWSCCPYMEFTCGLFHIWVHMWTLFPLWWLFTFDQSFLLRVISVIVWMRVINHM